MLLKAKERIDRELCLGISLAIASVVHSRLELRASLLTSLRTACEYYSCDCINSRCWEHSTHIAFHVLLHNRAPFSYTTPTTSTVFPNHEINELGTTPIQITILILTTPNLFTLLSPRDHATVASPPGALSKPTKLHKLAASSPRLQLDFQTFSKAFPPP
jgi:hypothetical protein